MKNNKHQPGYGYGKFSGSGIDEIIKYTIKSGRQKHEKKTYKKLIAFDSLVIKKLTSAQINTTVIKCSEKHEDKVIYANDK